MSRLIVAFIDIALHRRGPEDLPASELLFGLVLAVYLAVGCAALLVHEPLLRAVPIAVVEAALLLAFLAAVLHAFKLQRRFLQSATAMLGTDTLFNAISVPVRAWSSPGEGVPATGAGADIPAVLLLLLLCWSVDVSSFVLSRALERPYLLGLSIMIGYVFLAVSLSSAFLANR